ncbi:perilipin-3-like [Petaurus breviceps papuanus]|uniref:perilipin-3-like n=1 Tax=Petaurus breviceps papuanus TaxID=3040969 RepID=UPI0036DF145F
MDRMCTVARKSLGLAETRASPSQTEKTDSDKLDAKQIMMRFDAKTSSEPISQERMSKPQVLQEELYSSKEIFLEEIQPLKETDSLVNASSGYAGKEDTASVGSITTRFVSNEEKILSAIQKKRTAQKLKLHMDKYLPMSLDMANIQESSEENEDYFRENSSRDKGNSTSLDYLPSNLQAHKNTMENIRSTKNNIRKLLYQLYEAIELTYQSKQGSEDQQNYQKALFKMWIKWSQSENVNDDSQLLEALTLDMFCGIALKLELAFMNLMPQVQSLPSSIQDKLQQACYDMQELYKTFSLSNGFEDLDKHHLTQSQLKLTQAQGSIEKWFFFLEDGISSGWIVEPLSASEYPFPEVLALPKENTS